MADLSSSRLLEAGDLADAADEVTGRALLWKQFRALFIKRFRNASRDYKAVMSQVLLPAAFVCLAMIAATSFPNETNQPPIKFDLSSICRYCHGTRPLPFSTPVYDKVCPLVVRGSGVLT